MFSLYKATCYTGIEISNAAFRLADPSASDCFHSNPWYIHAVCKVWTGFQWPLCIVITAIYFFLFTLNCMRFHFPMLKCSCSSVAMGWHNFYPFSGLPIGPVQCNYCTYLCLPAHFSGYSTIFMTLIIINSQDFEGARGLFSSVILPWLHFIMHSQYCIQNAQVSITGNP